MMYGIYTGHDGNDRGYSYPGCDAYIVMNRIKLGYYKMT